MSDLTKTGSVVTFQRGDGSYIEIDQDHRILKDIERDVVIHLTPIEWKIFEMLSDAKGKIVLRDELLHVVWDDPSMNWQTRTVDVHVAALRKKLAILRGLRIDSIYGKGYKLVILSRF